MVLESLKPLILNRKGVPEMVFLNMVFVGVVSVVVC
jgi:hypothetical protein